YILFHMYNPIPPFNTTVVPNITPTAGIGQFTTTVQSQGSQFGRKWGLIVGATGSSSALDLTGLEIEFKTTQGSFESPSTAVIRIFNPAPNTINKIQKEYNTVKLQAGYQNANFGIIFDGIIMQVKTGKI